jgi:aryl sulfotransferase
MRQCSFDDTKANASGSVPLVGAFGEDGAKTFVRKGTNGRLGEELSLEHSAAPERRAIAEPNPECAVRLLTGDLW